MKVYKNVDVVQVNIKQGVREFVFPKNVDWSDQVIDKILVYGCGHDLEEFSPIDGVTPILDREGFANVYFDLYADDGSEIAYALNAQNIMFTNNNPLEINSKISLQRSRIFFAEASPKDGCILLYVFYGSKDVDSDIPQKNVTVTFNVPNGSEILLSDVIDSYIHGQGAKLKGIYFWGILSASTGYFITLRNRNYKTILNRLALGFCRPPMGSDYMSQLELIKAEGVQINPMYLDNEDVDFSNSFIQNSHQGGRTFPITLTFLY